MDFFETLFGLSPDGGDGSTEAMWFGAIAIAAAVFLFRRRLLAWVSARAK